MRIVVLLHRIPDIVEDLEVDESGVALNAEYLKLTLNEFDDQALEEALLLKEETSGELTAIAFGGDVDKTLFIALAKGADRAIEIKVEEEIGDSLSLARIFTEALGGLEYDLVLTGVQAADDRDGQLAPMVAAMLGCPCVEVVTGVAVGDDMVTLKKEYSGGIVAEFEVDLPAVLGIQAARQTPRYAPVSKVRQVQQSTTIETVESTGPGAGAGVSIVVMTPPEIGAGAQMLESAEELLELLESKGVLS